jgi:hypothetical protein
MENDWTKVLGFPGYRVYKQEIDEEHQQLKLWIRRKRGNRSMICSGCGRRVHQIHEVYEREIRDLPVFEYQSTVVVELYRVEQYQLFETSKYIYRVFVTSMEGPLHELVAFYNQRAAAENLIKEANNDAGLAAHPSGRWMMNCNWFQIAMLAYNLNCWLQLFNREEGGEVGSMRHTTLATARLRFLFLAAKIWRHAGRVGVSYSDHYEDQGLFHRLMHRVRAIAPGGDVYLPVLQTVLT